MNYEAIHMKTAATWWFLSV